MQDREDALASGTVLEGYRFDAVLGAGGFGITYLATEILIDRLVAIKEYMPNGIAHREPNRATVRPLSASYANDFAWGLGRFRDEAKTLVALRHPHIVCVNHYFEANSTGYLVMEYERGKSLGQLVHPDLTLDESEIDEIVFPLLEGLAFVHARGFLHRDIKPDNIFIRDDGTPVLIDFGTARQALVERSKSLTAIVTPGYAPMEQYESTSKQGPWTDLYAVGAVLYRCVTGERPPDAPARVAARFRGDPDPLTAVADAARGPYSAKLLAAIESALTLDARARPQHCDAFAAMLRSTAPTPDTASETLAAGYAAPPMSRPTSVANTAAETLATPAPRRRRRGPWIAAAAVVALLGASYAGYAWYDSRNSTRADTQIRLADMLRQARAAIEKGALDDAKRLIDEAARIDSASAEVAAARAALASALDRRRRANERIERARSAIARNDPAGAEQEAAEAERIDPTAADFAALRTEIAAVRQRLEADARRKAEEEAAKRRAEEEKRRQAEEEAKRRRADDDRRKGEEDAARRRSEEETRRKAEEEARRKAEDDARGRGEDDARRKAEDEVRRRAEEEKRKAEEERRKAERDRGAERIGPGMRNNLNLPGEDYANFDLPSPDPALCQQRCQGDTRCVAWTYVRVGVQGKQARCWLKNRVPAQQASTCCVSGAVQRDGTGATQRIEWPRIGDYYVDNCLHWARECGKPAADAYCRQAGYRAAQSWAWQYRAPTLVMGDRQICSDAARCGALSYVVCVR